VLRASRKGGGRRKRETFPRSSVSGVFPVRICTRRNGVKVCETSDGLLCGFVLPSWAHRCWPGSLDTGGCAIATDISGFFPAMALRERLLKKKHSPTLLRSRGVGAGASARRRRKNSAGGCPPGIKFKSNSNKVDVWRTWY